MLIWQEVAVKRWLLWEHVAESIAIIENRLLLEIKENTTVVEDSLQNGWT